jgi:FeS assembly SUF system protein
MTKELPMVQPPAAQPPPKRTDLETAGMVNDAERSTALTAEIIKALSTVYDPEIPVNIYELGLIYDIIVDAASTVGIRMTLTAPACPAAQFLPEQVRTTVAAVPGVSAVKVDVVWEPPWDRDRMSEAAKLQLGLW